MTPDTTRALRERPFYPYLFESLARDVTLTVLDLAAGERVLEVGAGRGEVLLKLATLVGPTGFAAGTETDAPSRALCEARLREAGLSHFEVRDAAAGALPFAASSFDSVYAAYLLGAHDDDESKRILADLRRVLRPGGRVALCGPTFGERAVPKVLARTLGLVRRLGRGAPQLARRAQGLAVDAGFDVDRRLYLEQRGFPCEVLLLRRRESLGIRQ